MTYTPQRAVSRATLEREMLHALDLSPKVAYPQGCIVPGNSTFTEYTQTLNNIAALILQAQTYGFVSAEHERHRTEGLTSASCHDCAMEAQY